MEGTGVEILERIRKAKDAGAKGLDLSRGSLKEPGDPLRTLPTELLSLRALSVLDLSGHALEDLAGIEALSMLRTLDVSDNALAEIPEQVARLPYLQELILRRNRVKRVSPVVLRLDQLRRLDLDGNPIENLPPEVLSHGIDAVRSFLRQIDDEGTEALREAKILVLGDGAVGKTSLVRRLLDEPFDSNTELTHGISVNRWLLSGDDGEDLHVHFWDFGGQEIYHATHQLFLSPRVLYLLVVDPAQDNDRIHYWLNLIDVLGDGSRTIIIENERKGRRTAINERSLRSRYSSIRSVIRIDVASGAGLEEAKREISRALSTLPHIGARLPRSWFRVRTELAETSNSTLSLSRYMKLCADHGLDESQSMELSRYLHDLGFVLHFQDDLLLSETLILDPPVVSAGILHLLEALGRGRGIYRRAEAIDAWRARGFGELSSVLLRLMVLFELGYIVDGERLVIPQLLPKTEPPHAWDGAGNLLVEQHYEFLPSGLMIRFLVKLQRFVEADLIWSDGAILRDGGTRAKVVRDTERRRISMRLVGAESHQFLVKIVSELESVHRAYARLEAEQYIACPCSTCRDSDSPHLFPVTYLANSAKRGPSHVQCQISFEEVPLSTLFGRLPSMGEKGLKAIPDEVLRGGVDAVEEYSQLGIESGLETLREARLLIIGEPRAGKTSLMKKLVDPEYVVPQEEDSTLGIFIHLDWNFPSPTNPSERFRANIWDFGGQEIQYMTHQFFLSPRAVYVLVADDREQRTDFDYWFDIVTLLAKGSPVLVVLNQRNYKFITNYDENRYKEEYKELEIDRFDIDLAQDADRLEKLAERIQTLLMGLDGIGTEALPKGWVTVRGELEELKSRKLIGYEEYEGICNRNGIPEGLQPILLAYLHDLGVVLHFERDPSLGDVLITNPQWAVDGVYAVLSDRAIEGKGGRFSRSWLFEKWEAKGYRYVERNRLLNLMKKDNLDICYELPGQSEEYIAPQLLPGKQPSLDWVDESNLRFRFQYPFMPKGLMARLIVRLNTHLDLDGEGMDLAWKRGAVFATNFAGPDVGEQGKCRARVTEGKSKDGLSVLDISVAGPIQTKRKLLTVIREAIQSIHSRWFKEIAVNEMIPCSCHLCAEAGEPFFFQLSFLRRCMRDDDAAQCHISGKRLNPLALVDDTVGHERFVEEEASRGDGFPEQVIKVMVESMKAQHTNNAWVNGSFYLVASVVALSAVAVISNKVPWYALPVVFVSGILVVSVLGLLQLRNDGRLSGKRFTEAIGMLFAELPLLGRFSSKRNGGGGPANGDSSE